MSYLQNYPFLLDFSDGRRMFLSCHQDSSIHHTCMIHY
jgi:hypothetical protein